jgi:hypothetical protein
MFAWRVYQVIQCKWNGTTKVNRDKHKRFADPEITMINALAILLKLKDRQNEKGKDFFLDNYNNHLLI